MSRPVILAHLAAIAILILLLLPALDPTGLLKLALVAIVFTSLALEPRPTIRQRASAVIDADRVNITRANEVSV